MPAILWSTDAELRLTAATGLADTAARAGTIRPGSATGCRASKWTGLPAIFPSIIHEPPEHESDNPASFVLPESATAHKGLASDLRWESVRKWKIQSGPTSVQPSRVNRSWGRNRDL